MRKYAARSSSRMCVRSSVTMASCRTGSTPRNSPPSSPTSCAAGDRSCAPPARRTTKWGQSPIKNGDCHQLSGVDFENAVVVAFGRALHFGRCEPALRLRHEFQRAGKPAAEHVAGLLAFFRSKDRVADTNARAARRRIERLDAELAPTALRQALHVVMEDGDAFDCMGLRLLLAPDIHRL